MTHVQATHDYFNMLLMLLMAFIVRSTTQKGKSLSESNAGGVDRVFRVVTHSHNCTMYALLGAVLLVYLDGTDKIIIVAIEGIVAHGPGGNKRKYMVL